MLDGSAAHGDEANIGNVENNNPISLISGGDGLSNAGNKARQLRRGGRKLRSAAPLHQHKAPRNGPNVRLSDHNNNNTQTGHTQPGTELPAGTQTVLSLHQLKQGAKKELLKSKGGRLERGSMQPGGQPARNLPRHDQITQNVITRSHKPKQIQTLGTSHPTRKKDNSSPNKPPPLHQPPLREQKKPLHASNNVKIAVNTPPSEASLEYLKDGDKVYAGAKFSEPPSPSVLPKPPSHWVGENEPQQSDQSREQMTVHLKSLLKVPDKS
ncbi:Proline-rich nuclear receptor coactivator 1 Proline-rich protein 2 [Larimichthys crocea]|uniref:Proline-rich nuclear receptor coactivator 1 n=1 Tax=Larimichthys crocea TaxID=215358 RepID=A0A0F8CKJ7_LARCR|nr:proline-rich nuclear receptor coactivator 1 [Larimichthys crocea]KAE8286522.1 Proline-rich nuclear receptor coactivator 1 Proline-rich protein 2 [Larimichthys crocea]